MGSKIFDIDESHDEYRTMAEVAFIRLRDGILRGALMPGDRIPQAAIADELKISRMPVREALRRLQERGFVTITPHRGAFVTPISPEQLHETYFVRSELEAASAKIAAQKMDDERILRLEALLEEAADALADGQGVRLAELNRGFHLVGHEASGLAMLSRIISDLSDHCQRYRLMHAALGDRARVALAEHVAILDAWRRRDGEAAAEAIRINLANSERALIQAIESVGASGPAKGSALSRPQGEAGEE